MSWENSRASNTSAGGLRKFTVAPASTGAVSVAKKDDCVAYHVVIHEYCYGRRVSGDTRVSIGSGRSSVVKVWCRGTHNEYESYVCRFMCYRCKRGTWRADQMEVDVTFGMVS